MVNTPIQFILLSLILLLNFDVSANHAVTRDSDNTTINYSISGAAQFSLVADGGDGSSLSNPINIYIPVRTNTDGDSTCGSANENDQHNYHISTNANNITEVKQGNANPEFQITLDVDFVNDESRSDENTDLLRVGVQETGDDSTNFKILDELGTVISSDINSSTISINLSDICEFDSDTSFDCTKFAETTNDNNKDSILLYIFAARSSTGVRTTIDSSDGQGFDSGIFIKVFFSNTEDQSTDVDINSITKGDGRLSINYSGTSIDDFHHVRVLNFNSTPPACTTEGRPYQTYTNFTAEEFPASTEASITIKNLTNGVTKTFALAFVNKYGFATQVSNQLSETPQDILEILEANACFFLTAGFGGDHHVVTYFRNFRDQILMKYSLGQKMVAAYYDFAPKHAMKIYESESLSALVRGVAYIAYYVLRNIYLIIAFFVAGSYLYFRRKYKTI